MKQFFFLKIDNNNRIFYFSLSSSTPMLSITHIQWIFILHLCNERASKAKNYFSKVTSVFNTRDW